MTALEDQALKMFSNTPSTWYRLVDDVLAIVGKTTVNNLQKHLDEQNESIKFTMETEQRGCLSFMDVIMTRCEDRISRTTVLRKKRIDTVRHFKFESNSPISVKRSVAMSLFHHLNYVAQRM